MKKRSECSCRCHSELGGIHMMACCEPDDFSTDLREGYGNRPNDTCKHGHCRRELCYDTDRKEWQHADDGRTFCGMFCVYTEAEPSGKKW